MKLIILIRKKLKKFFKKPVIKIILISLVTIFSTIVIIFGVFYLLRFKIARFIVSNYIPQEKAEQQNFDNLLTLDSFEQKIKDIRDEIVIPKELEKDEESVVAAVKKAKPAVVSIILTKEVPKYLITYKKENALDSRGKIIPNKYTQVPVSTENGTESKQVGSGSGFIISSDGLIVTNSHVVNQTGVDYKVLLNDGAEYNAKVLAKDSILDIALIKIEAKKLPYLEFADSDQLLVGQSVVAIGNALGEFKNTVSVGVISGLSRSITAEGNFGISEKLDKVIQTDAAINPGNSGGPLLNLLGEVVGINVAVAQKSSNVGFSLPINSVKDVISSVKKTGRIIRPYVGIRYLSIDQKIKSTLDLSVDYGILIQKGKTDAEPAIILGSPAEKAGLKEGDIILEVDNQKIDANNDFAFLVRNRKIGDFIFLKILSSGIEKVVALQLEQAPESW